MKLRSRKVAIAASISTLFLTGAIVIGVAGVIPTDKDIENGSKVNNEETKTVIEENEGTLTIEPIDRELVMGSIRDVITDTNASASDNKSDKAAENVDTENAETKEPETEQVKSEYDDKFMVNINDYLNIRAAADEESEIVGKLYAGAGGAVLEKGEAWTKISSGSVEGYVSTEYLLFGEDAKKRAEETGTRKATITEDNIRVRKEPGTEAGVLGLADLNSVYTASNVSDGWVEINYDGDTGYVSADYVSVELVIGKAISIEEEQEQIRLEEERKRQQELEEEEQRKEAERQAEEARIASNNRYVETVVTASYDVAEDDTYLLACLVHAEAGSEPYEGKLAVANVVLNRVNSGRYGNSISDVVYARGQFSVVTNGRLASVIANGPNSESLEAAREALAGVNNVPDYLYFCMSGVANYSRYNHYSIIGTQVFYN